MPVTAKDIAAHLGIAQSSVSRALQGKKVSRETIEKVRRAARELGYSPNLGARMMATGRTGIYGLLMPRTANPYFGSVIERTQALALEDGHYVALGSYNDDFSEFQKYIELFVQQRLVDGLIVYPMHDGRLHETIAAVAGDGIPIVMMGIDMNPQVHWVHMDHQFGWQQLTEHLLDLGHRHIGVIMDVLGQSGGEPRTLGEDHRYIGLRHAMAARGIPWSDEAIVECESSLAAGYTSARQILERRPRPTAILASNDLMAMGVIGAARDLGLEIPRDLSVTGYDNTEFSHFFKITTVDNLTAEVIAAPIEILRQVLGEGFEQTGKLTRHFFPTLIVRGSTCPPQPQPGA